MEGIEQNSSFLDIRGLSRKMQLLIIAFYIYIYWCYFGPLGIHGKERKRACTQEREIFLRTWAIVRHASGH